MGALGAAISGLQSSQRWLDVISNNVSNSNTVAYKSSRLTFSDIISQGIGSASGSNTNSNLGGINPVQLGLGVNVSSIQTIFNQGALQTTGNATDVAINGSGFLTVSKGSETLFTRAGNLTFDSNGNLVTSDGGLVQGWQAQFTRTNDNTPVTGTTRILTAQNIIDTNDVSKIGNITIPRDLVIEPQATSKTTIPAVKDEGVVFKGNLDEATPLNINAETALGGAGQTWWIGAAGALKTPGAGVSVVAVRGLVPDPFNNPVLPLTPDHVMTSTVYDSVGDPHQITIWMFQVGETANALTPQPPQWAWYAFDTTFKQGSPSLSGAPTQLNLLGGTGLQSDPYTNIAGDQQGTLGFVSFNNDGSMQTNGSNTNLANTIQPNILLHIPNPWGAAGPVPPIVMPSGGVDSFTFSLNFGTPNIYVNAGDAFLDPFASGAPATGTISANGDRSGLTGDYGNGNTILVAGVPTYQPNSTGAAIFQDGFPAGQLLSVSFDQTGTIRGNFTNGQNLALATLAIASIGNPEGLAKLGGNYYATTANSGSVRFDVAGSNGYGTIQGGTIESSNVDLTLELTNMILAQRMFESNARVVTAADRVLDTLVNLGR